MKRSLYSLVAGCLAALVVDSFAARPLWVDISHRPADDCTSPQVSGPGSKRLSQGLPERRKAPLGSEACEPAEVLALALPVAEK